MTDCICSKHQWNPSCPIHGVSAHPAPKEAQPLSDKDALDRINELLSAPEWPGASGMEDVCHIVRLTGRVEVSDAPPWERH